MGIGRTELKRVMVATSLGLGAVVWAVAQAAQGDWAFYALALVLTVATNLTVVELADRRPAVQRQTAAVGRR